MFIYSNEECMQYTVVYVVHSLGMCVVWGGLLGSELF